jgi:hypothetical protein
MVIAPPSFSPMVEGLPKASIQRPFSSFDPNGMAFESPSRPVGLSQQRVRAEP